MVKRFVSLILIIILVFTNLTALANNETFQNKSINPEIENLYYFDKYTIKYKWEDNAPWELVNRDGYICSDDYMDDGGRNTCGYYLTWNYDGSDNTYKVSGSGGTGNVGATRYNVNRDGELVRYRIQRYESRDYSDSYSFAYYGIIEKKIPSKNTPSKGIGELVESNIIAPEGTYPTNGEKNDSWYLRKNKFTGNLVYYDKYNAVEGGWVDDSEWILISSNSYLASYQPANQAGIYRYKEYDFNPVTNIYSYKGNTRPATDYYYIISNNGTRIEKHEPMYVNEWYDNDWVLNIEYYGRKYYKNISENSRGKIKGPNLLQRNIKALEGFYPDNGLHTDGYWYIKRGEADGTYYMWDKHEIERIQGYYGNGQGGSFDPDNTRSEPTHGFRRVDLDPRTGKLTGVDPVTCGSPRYGYEINTCSYIYSSGYYYVITYESDSWWELGFEVKRGEVDVKADFIENVFSLNQREYPEDGIKGNYWYTNRRSISTNMPPELDLIIEDNVTYSEMEGHNKINVSGNLKDNNGDEVDIFYTISPNAKDTGPITQEYKPEREIKSSTIIANINNYENELKQVKSELEIEGYSYYSSISSQRDDSSIELRINDRNDLASIYSRGVILRNQININSNHYDHKVIITETNGVSGEKVIKEVMDLKYDSRKSYMYNLYSRSTLTFEFYAKEREIPNPWDKSHTQADSSCKYTISRTNTNDGWETIQYYCPPSTLTHGSGLSQITIRTPNKKRISANVGYGDGIMNYDVADFDKYDYRIIQRIMSPRENEGIYDYGVIDYKYSSTEEYPRYYTSIKSADYNGFGVILQRRLQTSKIITESVEGNNRLQVHEFPLPNDHMVLEKVTVDTGKVVGYRIDEDRKVAIVTVDQGTRSYTKVEYEGKQEGSIYIPGRSGGFFTSHIPARTQIYNTNLQRCASWHDSCNMGYWDGYYWGVETDNVWGDGYYHSYYYYTKEIRNIYYMYNITLTYSTNKPPSLGLDMDNGGVYSEYSPHNKIAVKGIVSDSTGDIVNLNYTIQGLPSHTNKKLTTIIANGNEQKFNVPITVNSTIPEGEYTLHVWAVDDKEALSEIKTVKFKVDKTPPVINNITIISNNKNSNHAKVGDQVTITFTVGEEIASLPEVIVNGKSNAVTRVSGNTYRAIRVMTDDDNEGEIKFSITAKDDVLNPRTVNNTTDNSSVLFYKTAPRVTNISISSNNSEGGIYTKSGDISTISFKTNRRIDTGNYLINDIPVNLNRISKTEYTIFKELTDQDSEGVVGFKLMNMRDMSGNEIMNDLAYTSDGTILIHDTTPPVLSTIRLSSNNGNLVKIGDEITLELISSEELKLSPSVRINGNLPTLIEDNKILFVYKYSLKESDPEGPIIFIIDDYKDLAGNKGKVESSTTDGSEIVFSNTKTNIEYVSIYSSNSNSSIALPNDTIQVVFDSSSKLKSGFRVLINGVESETLQELDNNRWIASRVMTGNEPLGLVEFKIEELEDSHGNTIEFITSTTDNSYVTFKKLANTEITKVSIKSNNEDPSRSKVSDEVIIGLHTTSNLLEIPVVRVAQGFADLKTERDNYYEFVYKLTNVDQEGNIEFVISNLYDEHGSVLDVITETTDKSKVLFDKTPPKLNNVTIINPTVGDSKLKINFTASERLKRSPSVEVIGLKAEVVDLGNNQYRAELEVTNNSNEKAEFRIYDIVDLAGNVGEVVTNSTNGSDIVIDVGSKVMISYSGVENNGIYEGSVIPVFSASSSESQKVNVSAKLNNVEFKSGTPIRSNGTYNLVITAVDSLGNSETLYLNFTIN